MSSNLELLAWLNGTPGGGPSGNGRYPMTYKDERVHMILCPAAQALNPGTDMPTDYPGFPEGHPGVVNRIARYIGPGPYQYGFVDPAILGGGGSGGGGGSTLIINGGTPTNTGIPYMTINGGTP